MNPQALQSVALAVAEARSVETVLGRIVLGLLAQEGVAVARRKDGVQWVDLRKHLWHY